MILRKSKRSVPWLALLLLLVLNACNDQPAPEAAAAPTPARAAKKAEAKRAKAPSSVLDRILERGELRLGVSPGFAPFVVRGKKAEEMATRATGKIEVDPSGVSGFDVELARALADSLGVKLAVKIYDGALPLQAGLAAGEVDLALSGLTRTLERARRFYFSQPYFVSGLVVLVPKKSPWLTLPDLNNPQVEVLVKPGTTSETFAKLYLPQAKIIPVADEEKFAEAFSAGGRAAVIDAVKARSFQLAGLLKIDFRRLENRRFTDEYYGVLLPRDEPLARYVDLFLNDFKRSGRFQELASRFNPWFRSED